MCDITTEFERLEAAAEATGCYRFSLGRDIDAVDVDGDDEDLNLWCAEVRHEEVGIDEEGNDVWGWGSDCNAAVTRCLNRLREELTRARDARSAAAKVEEDACWELTEQLAELDVALDVEESDEESEWEKSLPTVRID